MSMLFSVPSDTHRLRGPADLLQAIPYLLGFHPAASLVLVGLNDGMLVVTARLDLADAVYDELLVDTLGSLARGGSEQIVGVVFDDRGREPDRSVWDAVTESLASAAHVARCELADVLAISEGRWWSLWCDEHDCCPPAGSPLPEHPSAFAAAATVAGVVPLAGREALARSLDAAPAHLLLHPVLLARCQQDAIESNPDARAADDAKAVLRAALESDEVGWSGIQPSELARCAVALTNPDVRDRVWEGVDHRRVDGRALWRDIARRAPGHYRAPALFLFGWSSWRHGDGALANIAADRTLACDPTYAPADVLHAVIAQHVDPKRVPKLRFAKRRAGSADPGTQRAAIRPALARRRGR